MTQMTAQRADSGRNPKFLTLQRRAASTHIPAIITSCPYPEIKTQGNLLRLMSYAAVKGKHHAKIGQYQDLPDLPSEFRGQNAGDPVTFDDQCRYAMEVCDTLVNPRMLTEVAQNIVASEQQMRAAGKQPHVLKLILPQPVVSDGSKNVLVMAFALAIEQQLPAVLEAMRPENSPPLAIQTDCETIVTLTVAGRGLAPKNTTDDEIKLNDIGRIARQHCFAGVVDPDALYGIVDDSVFHQSTLRNLHDFIIDGGGNVAFLSCLTHGYTAREMNVSVASGALLETILQREHVTIEALNAVLNNKQIFGEAGLYFRGADDTNLTQFEVLLLTAYFGSEQDKPMLKAVVAPLCEQAVDDHLLKKAKLLEVLALPPGNAAELEGIFCEALQMRQRFTGREPRERSPWADRVQQTLREAGHVQAL